MARIDSYTTYGFARYDTRTVKDIDDSGVYRGIKLGQGRRLTFGDFTMFVEVREEGTPRRRGLE